MTSHDAFEQRARSAGAALRTAFYERDEMSPTSTLSPAPRHRSPSQQGSSGGSGRRRALALAAAAAVAVCGVAALTLLPGGGGRDQVLPPATPPAGPVIEVQGVRIPLPEDWRIDARSSAYVQAGNPGRRDVEGTNVVVPTSVVEPDGGAIPTPPDVLGWLEERPDVTVGRMGTVDVDGSTGTVVRVTPRTGSVVLWCGGAAPEPAPDSCFNTGQDVLYVLVPFGEQTLVVETGTGLVADGLTEAELQEWVRQVSAFAATADLPE